MLQMKIHILDLDRIGMTLHLMEMMGLFQALLLVMTVVEVSIQEFQRLCSNW